MDYIIIILNWLVGEQEHKTRGLQDIAALRSTIVCQHILNYAEDWKLRPEVPLGLDASKLVESTNLESTMYSIRVDRRFCTTCELVILGFFGWEERYCGECKSAL